MNELNSPLDPKPKRDDTAQTFADAQLEKLNLEIQQLRRKPRWLEPMLQILPVATVLVSTIAFFFGVYQYVAVQKKARANEQIEQRIRIEAQARADLEQIVQFPTDTKQTVSHIDFLLVDLERIGQLLDLQRRNADAANDSLQQKRDTSAILANVIQQDIDFGEPRNIDFAASVLNNWPDYGELLKENPDYIKNILARQEDALTELRRKVPNYFEQIVYDEKTGLYHEPKNTVPLRTPFRLFEKLSNSFASHLELLKDEPSKNDAIKQFQAAICNRGLTQKWFKKSFDPKDDPRAFNECPKSR